MAVYKLFEVERPFMIKNRKETFNHRKLPVQFYNLLDIFIAQLPRINN